MPNGILHSGYTDKTQATARLVIVLEKKWRWRQQLFWTGTGTLRFDRPKWEDRSKWTTFKGSPKHCGRTEPKWSVPFDFYPKFPEFWTEWKGPRCDLQVTWVRVGPRYGFQKSELIDQISPFENKVTVFFFFFSRFFLIPTLPILTCINSSDLTG